MSTLPQLPVPPSPDRPGRRAFLKHVGCLTAAGTGVLGAVSTMASEAGHGGSTPQDPDGVLLDLGACIGCRACEHACKEAAGFEAGNVKDYEDPSVFASDRRPAPDSYTVVNAYDTSRTDAKAMVYAKVNCLHCNHASCVSACIVGALRKQENGAVTYDAWKCIGCRYCMVACPFQIPTYEYDKALTPQVRKCSFCIDKTAKGEKPACVSACPREVMVFGKRKELVQVAHEKISAHPGRYIDHVYANTRPGAHHGCILHPSPSTNSDSLMSEPPPRRC